MKTRKDMAEVVLTSPVKLTAELATCREALMRLRLWAGLPNSSYSATISHAVADWIDAGMTGPLPPIPEHLRELHERELRQVSPDNSSGDAP